MRCILFAYQRIFTCQSVLRYPVRNFRQFLSWNSAFLNYLFPYFSYPMFYFALYGSTYMTVSISIERYLGICYPSIGSRVDRKSWFYIIPVVSLSVIFAMPRFFETRLVNWFKNCQGKFVWKTRKF